MASALDLLLAGEKEGVLTESQENVLFEARKFGLAPEPIIDSVKRAASAGAAGFNRGLVEGVPVGQQATELMLEGANRATLNTDANQHTATSRIPFNIMRTVGQTVAPTGALMGAAKGISRFGNQLIKAPFVESVEKQAPRVLATEGLTSTGAGVGGAGARELTGGSDTGGTVGELAGGFLPGIIQLSGAGVRGVARGVGNVRGTERATRRNAQIALETDAVDLKATLQKIDDRLVDEERIIAGTTGKVTGDTGLLARERGLRTEDPVPFIESDALDAERLRERTQQLAEGRPQDVTEFFETRIENIKSRLDKRLSDAQARAKTSSENVAPRLSKDEAGTLLHTEITDEVSRLRAEEKKIWSAVGVTNYGTEAIKDRAAAIVNNRKKTSDPRNLDPVILEIAGGKRLDKVPTGIVDENGAPFTRDQITDESLLNDVEGIDEIIELRSRLLDAARRERGKGAQANKQRLRHLNDMVDSIFESMTPQNVDDPTVLDAFNKARANSKALHDKTSEGPVADILARTSRGNAVIDPVLATSTVTPGGQAGGVAMRAVKDLLGELEGSVSGNAISEFMLNGFKKAAMPDGQSLNVNQARKFLADNDEALTSFPALQESLRVAIATQEASGMAQAGKVVLQRALTQSAASRFIKADPERALSTAIDSKNPSREITSLIQSAKKDPSGRALEGLRRTFVNVFTKRVSPEGGAVVGQGLPSEGPRFRASAARGFVDKNSKAIQLLFPGGLAKFKRIAKEATMAERDAIGASGSTTAQNLTTISTLGRMMGARIGPILGVPSLVATGTGGRIARATLGAKNQDKINAVIEEAILNPRFFRELMKKIPAQNEKASRRLEARINAFLIAAFTPEVPIAGSEQRDKGNK